MTKETLKQSLRSLRDQLNDPISLDDETRQQLSQAADTIEKVLDENQETDLREAHADIEQIALNFEARHPVFARLLGEVTDALVKLGI